MNTQGKVLGRKPRPWVLLLKMSPEDGLDDLPTTRHIERLQDIAQGEWDVLVCRDGVPWITIPYLYVVAFGGMVLGKHVGDQSAINVAIDIPIQNLQIHHPGDIADLI